MLFGQEKSIPIKKYMQKFVVSPLYACILGLSRARRRIEEFLIALKERDQGVDRLVGRRPARGKANDGVIVIVFFPEGIPDFFLQLF